MPSKHFSNTLNIFKIIFISYECFTDKYVCRAIYGAIPEVKSPDNLINLCMSSPLSYLVVTAVTRHHNDKADEVI